MGAAVGAALMGTRPIVELRFSDFALCAVDELVNQAANAFKAHLPGSTTVNLLTEKVTDGRVYVSTYPTMMNLIDEVDDDLRRFGPGYFDLIVIDEAHRSVYAKYGAIFDYFDAMLIGLTATPKDEVDHNTYRLFHLEDGVPTDNYTLEEAVSEGYLVDYRRQSQTFYLPDGDPAVLDMPPAPAPVAAAFDPAEVERLVRWAQANPPDYSYPAFCQAAKAAGCAGYIVSFPGRRVVYFGRTGETHVELFPS